MVNRTGRGSPIPQNRLPGGTSQMAVPRVNYSTTAASGADFDARAFQQTAQDLNRANERLQQRLDIRARDEGIKEGMIAGDQGDVPLRNDSTIRGRAFDDAAARTMQARTDTQMRVDADRIFEENKRNPGALKTKMDAQLQGLLASQLPDEVKIDLKNAHARMTQGYLSEAGRIAEAAQQDRDRAESFVNLNARMKSIDKLAMNAETDAKSAEQLALELQDLEKSLNRYGPAGSGAYSQLDIARTLTNAKESAKENRVLGKFEKAQTLAEKKEILKSFEDEFMDPSKPADFSTDQLDRLSGRMRQDINRKEAEIEGGNRMLEAAAKTMQGQMENGFNPGTAAVQQIEQQATLMGDARGQETARRVRTLFEFQDMARQSTPADLQNFINTERTRLNETGGKGEAPDPVAIARIEMGEKLLQNMNTALGSDPLSWAARVGLTQVNPVTFAGEEAMTTMQQRAQAAHVVAAHYGTPVQLLTKEETTQFANSFAAADADGKTALLNSVRAGFGVDAPSIFAAVSKDNPVLGHVAGLMNSAPGYEGLARDVMMGDQLIKSDTIKLLPENKVLMENVQDVYGNAFAAAPGAMTGAVETAKRLYAAAAYNQGKLSADDFDADLFQQKLNEAVGAHVDSKGNQYGGIIEWKHDQKLIIPPDISEREFENLMDDVSDDDLAAASVGGSKPRLSNGEEFNAGDFSDMYFVPMDNGRYLVSMDDPREGKRRLLLGSGTNGYYEFDILQLRNKKQKK